MSMRPTRAHEIPSELVPVLHKAQRLEWISIAYVSSLVVTTALAMGSSQAMKTVWIEDILGLIPPIAVLLSIRIAHKTPNETHPYGYHRAVSVAFVCAAVALTCMGVFLIVDAVEKLILTEHPTVGSMRLFGHDVWQGWVMLVALAWSTIPSVFLGRAKLPLARKLHNKALHTDAAMNKADWMTGVAAMLGVLGIGFGLWWADSLAAAIISIDVLHDGVRNLKRAIGDLMDRAPQTVDYAETDPLTERVKEEAKSLSWVHRSEVRLRENGHVYFGEVFVEPSDESDLVAKVREATERIQNLSWRVHDIVVTPVRHDEQTAREPTKAD